METFRGTVLNVDPAPRYRLADAPLAQAVVQINYPTVAALQTLEGIAPLQDELQDAFPYMQRSTMSEFTMNLGPAGPISSEPTNVVVHSFTNDTGWTLTVTPSSAALSVGSEYQGINDFAERFEHVVNALNSKGRFNRCTRLGVRYLDLVDIEADPEWHRWFRPEFVGLADPAVAPNLVQTLTEVRLRSVAGEMPVDGVLRYGVVPADSVLIGVPPRKVAERSYLFDMDMSVEPQHNVRPSALPDLFRTLHAGLEDVFHWSLTTAGKARFGYSVEEA